MMAKIRIDAGVDKIFLHRTIARGRKKDLKNFLDETVSNDGQIEQVSRTIWCLVVRDHHAKHLVSTNLE